MEKKNQKIVELSQTDFSAKNEHSLCCRAFFSFFLLGIIIWIKPNKLFYNKNAPLCIETLFCSAAIILKYINRYRHVQMCYGCCCCCWVFLNFLEMVYIN